MKKLMNNDYILSIISKFSIILCGFISMVFLNRYLGVKLKGEYSSIINYATIISSVFQLGISSVYSLYKRKNIKNCYEIFISLSLIQLLLYFILSMIILIIHFDFNLFWIVLISVIAIFTTQLRYINLVENIKYNTIVVLIMSISNCILTIITFLFLKRYLPYAFIIYILKDITIVLLYTKRINFKNLFKNEYKKYYFLVLRDGILPMLSSFLIIINYKIDIAMLNIYKIDYVLIGLYSLGLSISEHMWIIPDIFKDVVRKRTAKDNSIQTINFSLRCSTTLIALAYIFIIIFGKFFIGILFGNDYINSYGVTIILFCGIFSMVYYKIIGQLLISDGKSKYYFIILLFGALVNIFFNIILIPKYDIIGAAFASVASYSFIGIVFLIFYVKMYKVHFLETIFVKKNDFTRIKNFIKKNKDAE